jgi:ribosomal protein L28
MNFSEEQIDPESKEQKTNDFGDVKLNETYKNLPENIQKQIDKFPKLETKISILKYISDPELNNIYEKLDFKKKQQIDNLNIRDKYVFLKKIRDINIKKEEELKKEKLVQFEPTTPEDSPQKEEKEEVEEQQQEQEEVEEKKEEKEEKGRKLENPQIRFERLVKRYFDYKPFIISSNNKELEVRFGTKGIKHINKNDYDNVIKKLKSLGFESLDENGEYSLRIQNEFLDNKTGLFKLSEIRTEIYGLNQIQTYCKTNDIEEVKKIAFNSVKFTNKKNIYIESQKLFPVNFDDFNFRVSLQEEETPKLGLQNFIISNWKKSKKTFRYLNRVTFTHPSFPINVDISIVKYGNKKADRYGNEGRGEMIRVYNINESNVFENQEVYEIELEVKNFEIGPGTQFNNYKKNNTKKE